MIRSPLHRDVLNAANALLKEQGGRALSCKRIAQRAGTSTQGIYTAFGGKPGLIDALYREGFRQLSEALATVPDRTGERTYIADLCKAYRRNALDHPEYFEIMFSRIVPEFDPSPESRAFALETFGVLVRAIEAAAARSGKTDIDARNVANTLWAAGHGVVALELAGYLGGGDPARHFDEVIGAVLEKVFGRTAAEWLPDFSDEG